MFLFKERYAGTSHEASVPKEVDRKISFLSASVVRMEREEILEKPSFQPPYFMNRGNENCLIQGHKAGGGRSRPRSCTSWLHLVVSLYYTWLFSAFKGHCNINISLQRPLKAASKKLHSPTITSHWPCAILCVEGWCHEFWLDVYDVFTLTQIWVNSLTLPFVTNEMPLQKGQFWRGGCSVSSNIPDLSMPWRDHVLRLGLRGSVF